MFPTGDGARVSLADMIQSQPGIFSANPRLTPMRSRRMSTESVQSGLFDTQQAQAISEVKQRWWGNKRLGEIIIILCNNNLHNPWYCRLCCLLPRRNCKLSLQFITSFVSCKVG